MKKTHLIKVALIVGLISVMPMYASAAANQGQGRPSKGAPPEAIAACKDKSAGASVEFKGREGETLEATCQEKDGQMVAVPKNMPQGGGPR
ncbi:MAG: hypothetical protein CVU69_11535 [Deltaproteobacteria bacterium HGW-Deltaproteobacteria-4]|nr:MAG: hypothetical protein CVU69_11535 [Deltaproteobacteria bacterium HGW-Deltaproteobacteria-4]